jgi:beta-lactamase regulating signal transducer with metallopeptidase domain
MSQLWTETAAWWIRLAVASGLFLLAATLLVAVCRQPIRRVRVIGWTFAIALLLLPLTLLPGWVALPFELNKEHVSRPSPASHPEMLAAAETTNPAIDLGAEIFESAEEATEQVPAAPPATAEIQTAAGSMAKEEPRSPALVANMLLLGYALIGLTLFGRLIVGQLQLERIWRSGQPASAETRRLFRRLADKFPCGPELRVSRRVAGPICFGFLRPRVVLPLAFDELADEKSLRWIFAHELSHLERRDPLVGWLIGFAQSLFFFWPWFWKLRREVRLNQEYLADASAVRMSTGTDINTPAEDYADFLVRLTSTGAIPLNASGVKSPTSDLYRRITMLLQKSGNVETTCPRRWSLVAGFGLLSLGLVLAGFHLSAKAEPGSAEKKADGPKKESVEDIEKEVQKALDALKKGPAAEPRKEEKEPPARGNGDDNLRKLTEALEKAKRALTDDPKSEDALNAFEAAMKAYQRAVQNQIPQFAPRPFIPGEFDDVEQLQKMVEEMQRQMMEQMRQLQVQPGIFPGRIGFGALPRGRDTRMSGDSRLGLRLEKPSATLVEQLDLPANNGMVVAEVRGGSPAAKAGIKTNDILLQIGGKTVPNDMTELQGIMKGFKGNQKVDIVVLRKGKKETIKDVNLPEPSRPADLRIQQEQGQPGITVPRFQFPNLRQAFPPEAFNGGNNAQMSMQINDGVFTINYALDGLKVIVVGNKDDGPAKATSITIEDGDKKITANSIEKLDEKYRPAVENLLKRIR